MRFISIILATMFITGCATQISKNKNFGASDKEGLVVLGVTSVSGPYALYFIKIDPTTCKASNWGGFGDKKFDNTLKSNTSQPHYIIDTFEPGTWVVGQVEYSAGYNLNIVNYSSGTIAFTVEPGKFIHVGDITIAKTSAKINKTDQAGLTAFLENYSNIHIPPSAIKPWSTHYYNYSSKEENTLCNPRPE